jgi:2-polyprenyl-6-methoxyphenol hydroxylase-like FAD-dependent oxidoreductase
MEPKSQAQVLVVGAGPVGLLAALRLRQRGLDVTVIDQNERSSLKGFAVVLHPRTLAMLSNLGLFEPFVWQGRSFKRIVIFSEGERRAILDIPADGELSGGGMTLPQNALRNALELKLQEQGVHVEYLHRLASITEDGSRVRAELKRREPVSAPRSSSGRFEWREVETLKLAADFVIGADGHESTVRKTLGIGLRPVAPPQIFGFFDVPHEPPAGQSLELVLGHETSAMYPLHGGTTRYSFELSALPAAPLDADKLRELRFARMPWHAAEHESVEWTGVHTFERAFAERFGQGRVWLAGDAAHTTTPLGSQSLNVGLREGRELANAIADSMEAADVRHLVTAYDDQRQLEWHTLLSLAGKPSLSPSTPTWAKQHMRDLVASLPASGDDLDDCLAQLGVKLL